ncbi:MAG: HlyD family secretion protein [Candidatus Omnitrophica bacterium]|nr:HlyD family secretion protein [Candidatus Omnitrophota bacterium]
MELQKNKKQKLIYLFIALAVLGLILLTVYLINSSNRIFTDDAYIEGRIHSIASKITGTIKQVLVEDNQGVKSGQVLIEIDPIDYELKVNEALATFGLRKASFDQAKRDMKRAQILYKQEVLPKEKYENVLTAYNLAKSQGEVAQAQLEIAQRNLKYTKIYAPCDGYVTKKAVEKGNQIQPVQPLMAVIPLDDIWITANYKETQLKNVLPGQKVEIKVDTYPNKKFTGRVDSIMAGTGAAFSLFPPENALGNYVKVVQRVPVKIVFDKNTDSGHILRIGMSCGPTIITKDDQSK